MVIENDPALDEIVDNSLSLLWSLEAQGRVAGWIRQATITATAVVFLREPLGLGFLTPRVEFFRFADAPIGLTFFQQLHRMAAIEVHSFGLSIGPFIPS